MYSLVIMWKVFFRFSAFFVLSRSRFRSIKNASSDRLRLRNTAFDAHNVTGVTTTVIAPKYSYICTLLQVVKLGGLPKRLDRLIEESKHLQVRL